MFKRDENNKRWYDAMVAKGHTPRMDEDDPSKIDMMAMSSEFHNGPLCETCFWSCCEHCQTIDKIPECKGK